MYVLACRNKAGDISLRIHVNVEQTFNFPSAFDNCNASQLIMKVQIVYEEILRTRDWMKISKLSWYRNGAEKEDKNKSGRIL